MVQWSLFFIRATVSLLHTGMDRTNRESLAPTPDHEPFAIPALIPMSALRLFPSYEYKGTKRRLCETGCRERKLFGSTEVQSKFSHAAVCAGYARVSQSKR